jgi:hypothetical protein
MSNTLYNHTSGVPVQQTRGVSSSIRAEFDLVQAGFDKAANKTGETYSGSHDFSGANISVLTKTSADSSTAPASTAFVTNKILDATLTPAQAAGNTVFLAVNFGAL